MVESWTEPFPTSCSIRVRTTIKSKPRIKITNNQSSPADVPGIRPAFKTRAVFVSCLQAGGFAGDPIPGGVSKLCRARVTMRDGIDVQFHCSQQRINPAMQWKFERSKLRE